MLRYRLYPARTAIVSAAVLTAAVLTPLPFASASGQVHRPPGPSRARPGAESKPVLLINGDQLDISRSLHAQAERHPDRGRHVLRVH